MGLCSSSSLTSKHQGTLNYSDLDEVIFIQHEYMIGTLTQEQIKLYYPQLNYRDLKKEKENPVKKRHFFKWYEMSYGNPKQNLKIENLLKSISSIKNSNINIFTNNKNSPFIAKDQKISESEQGLYNYWVKNPFHFESRVIKAPPIAFRWLGWLILTELPRERIASYYNNILTYPITEEEEIQIQKDLTRTLEQTHIMIKEINESMYRILKAITILDKEMSYVQGINFVCGFLLVISSINELDTFYLLISLFSKTFTDKFGMRYFYMDKFPYINVFTTIFEKNLEKKFPKVSAHIKKIQLPPICWISPWMQMLYVNVFPNECVLRVWDCFFVEGLPFLISFGLSIIEVIQKDLLELKDLFQITEYFKLLNPEIQSKFKDKKKKIKYNIDDMVYRAISKYKVKWEEIEDEAEKRFPNIDWDVRYEYKVEEKYKGVKKEIKFKYEEDSRKENNEGKWRGNEEEEEEEEEGENKSDKYEKDKNNNEEKSNNNEINEDDDEFNIDDEDDDANDMETHFKDIINKARKSQKNILPAVKFKNR